MKAGDQITVVRSDGTVEHDWYMWTDMDAAARMLAYSAPEMNADVRVMVIKRLDGKVPVPNDPDNPIMHKHPMLSTLVEWQKERTV
jgi:hypothetical protein